MAAPGTPPIIATVGPDGSLMAPLRLFYPYDRTVGAVIGRFLTSLAAKKIEGTRGHIAANAGTPSVLAKILWTWTGQHTYECAAKRGGEL